MAAGEGKPVIVSKRMRRAAEWLVDGEFASFTSENKLVLLSSCLRTTYTVQCPEVVKAPDDNFRNSLWGLRKKLCKEGWTEGTARTASIESKQFNVKNACKGYASLLLSSHSKDLENVLEFRLLLPTAKVLFVPSCMVW